MSKTKNGCKWEKQDENILTDMFWDGKSYDEIAKKLHRTWFACKCRLIKLKLIPYSPEISDMSLLTSVEKYDVPLRQVSSMGVCSQVDNNINKVQDTSRTFSDSELDVVVDYFKSRLARLAIQKLGVSIYATQIQIAQLEDLFTNEISKINIMKKMPISERERDLVRIA